MVDAFGAMNAVGLLAFAAAGALKGVDADLDLFGVTVLGTLTALGGGIVRDVLVGRIPVALRTTTDVGLAFAGVVIAVVLAWLLGGRVRGHPVVALSDAIGLAAFAATGALVGIDADLSAFGVVVLAALTGVGGGSLADVLLGRVPAVLHEDFYATPAVVGGAAFWIATRFDVATGSATLGCAVVVFALRVLALRGDWRLPTIG
ncbi:trimeric intracellular cation channel family protein [Halococcus sp. IIIV-5B]|uniref:trimeric intracellular cation channel family protein n=1 Tax=Halococcus sp. IIIV-5B TaxID=2321230 RepID=UPI000E714B1A|nr:TRIC cation channel family protein [Halococcus sp. IIIV-5B]RJT06751.1 trimeric intracellular cation channel family protein [Halococcus sp. IIIV-5B]